MPQHSSLLILSPDALFGGVAERVLKRLAADGWRLDKAALGILDPSDVAALYRVNRSERGCSEADSLVDRLFASGASFWCTVSRFGMPEGGVFNALKDLKGPSDPLLCGSNQLRRYLGATNPIMNLLHTSDSAADARWELSVMDRVRSRSDLPPANHSVDSIIPALIPTGEPRSPSGYAAVHRLKVLACTHPAMRDIGGLCRMLDAEAELLMSVDHVQLRMELGSLAHAQCLLVESERVEPSGLKDAFRLGRDLCVSKADQSAATLTARLSQLEHTLSRHLDRGLDEWSLLALHCEIEGIQIRQRKELVVQHGESNLKPPSVARTHMGR